MKLTFLSNYINHHQIPFCNACYNKLGDDFCFIQTKPMEEERLAMGWQNDAKSLPYVHLLYEEEAFCLDAVMNCDVLLAGWSDQEALVEARLNEKKPVIRISERIYREGQWKALSPRGLVHKYLEHTRYRKNKAYLLCAGAYVPSDFQLIHAYPGKMYRFGYFPETKVYTEEALEQKKASDGVLQIVWAGRFIPLKHPEMMVRLASYLNTHADAWQKEGIYHDFRIHMAGSGEMEDTLRVMAAAAGVSEKLQFYGYLKPEEVRSIMERSHIHVFTSNRLEGWGAVVNEAMNSGCAEVASACAGAVPYLISQGKNGLAYPDDDFEKMAEAVLRLASDDAYRRRLAEAGRKTITELWNAAHAAEEVLRFAGEILEGEPSPAKEGPLSEAPVVPERRMFAWMCR